MEENSDHSSRKQDPFNHFLFGSKRQQTEEEVIVEEEQEEELDYEQILILFDLLAESAAKLKPLFSKMQPFIEKMLNSK